MPPNFVSYPSIQPTLAVCEFHRPSKSREKATQPSLRSGRTQPTNGANVMRRWNLVCMLRSSVALWILCISKIKKCSGRKIHFGTFLPVVNYNTRVSLIHYSTGAPPAPASKVTRIYLFPPNLLVYLSRLAKSAEKVFLPPSVRHTWWYILLYQPSPLHPPDQRNGDSNLVFRPYSQLASVPSSIPSSRNISSHLSQEQTCLPLVRNYFPQLSSKRREKMKCWEERETDKSLV